MGDDENICRECGGIIGSHDCMTHMHIRLGCALADKYALVQKLARADARIAELEVDAARYRWLRKHRARGPYIVDVDGCAISGKDADSDIDAARAGNGGEG